MTDARAAVLFAFALYAGGFTSFLVAKLSVIRQGIRVSFGPKHMSPTHRALYYVGYILMAAGALYTVGILSFARNAGA